MIDHKQYLIGDLNRMKPIPNFFLVFLLLFANTCLGQAYHLSHFGVEDGLPSSEVYCIQQDHDGFMWFGTDRGAVRYDGQEFMQYGIQDGLHNDVVFELATDSKGNIWFGTFSPKMSYWDGTQIQDYAFNPALEEAQPKNCVKSALLVGAQGDLYLGTYGRELVHVSPSGVAKVEVSERRGSCREYEGRPLVFCNYKILPFESSPYLVEQFGSTISLQPNRRGDHYNAYCEVGPSGAWYFSVGQALYKLREGKVIWHKEFSSSSNFLWIDSKEQIWACHDKGGITIVDSMGLTLSSRFPQLEGRTISSVFQDREGGIWISSVGDGIFYLPTLQFSHIPVSNNQKGNQIFDLTVISDTHLVIATYNGAIQELIAPAHGGWKKETLFQIGQFPQIAWDHSRQQLWLARESLWRWAPGSTPEEIYYDLDGMCTNLSLGPTGNVSFGTNYGIRSMDFEIGSPLITSNRSERVYASYVDRNGVGWMGDINGLWTFENGQWVRPPWDHPSAFQRITDINSLSDGRLICSSTTSGILLLGKNGVETFGTGSGLCSNVVNQIAVDPDGVIWAGGNRGLQRIEISSSGDFSVKCFDLRHGMPFLEINQVSAGDSLIWFSGPGGVSQLNRYHLPIASSPPPVKLTSILVNGQSRLFGDGDSLSNSSLSKKTGLSLSYHENNLRLGFQALHYRTGGYIKYWYRLKGLEEDWRSTQDREASYSGVKPGNYVFEVSAPNEDGVRGIPTQLSIQIASPIWTRWWFVLLIALLSLAISGAFAGYFFRQWKHRHARERAVEKWKLKALQARINPHFTFNTLNTIQAYITTHDTEAAEWYLNKFSQLIRKVLQQSEASFVSLADELELLGLYLDLNQMRFEEAFEYTLEVEEGVNRDDILLPPMVVQPFVENAVLHGLLPKAGKSQLKIWFGSAAGAVHCIVEDNGIGRKAALKRQESRGKLHKSVGMGLVTEQLDLLGGTQGEHIKITDLTGPDGQPLGTRVELMIPKQSYESNTHIDR